MSGPRPTPRLDGPLVFVDVDTQRDFLDPSGALFIAGSPAIGPNLASLTAFARDSGIPVVATACAHGPDAAEFAVFPPHCLLGTPGQARVDATAWPGGLVLAEGESLPSGTAPPPHVTLNKDAYDLFSRPDAAGLFARYAEATGGATFVVYGVATDYCVGCVVDGLAGRGHPTALVVDAVRAVDPAAEPDRLTAFARRGVLLTLTEAVLASRGASTRQQTYASN